MYSFCDGKRVNRDDEGMIPTVYKVMYKEREKGGS
jgi:hypothetical protein